MKEQKNTKIDFNKKNNNNNDYKLRLPPLPPTTVEDNFELVFFFR